MPSRFEKFSEGARKVLTHAQEEAQKFNHNYIGTEHILLGLVREGDDIAARVLSELGVELGKVRSAVEFIIGRGERTAGGDIGLTPRAKKVIELAVDEARRLSHSYIGTEHLLIGLMREGEGVAAGVLESLGVNLDKVRGETTRLLTEQQRAPASAGPSQSPSGRSANRTPTLDQHGVDLTALAREGKLDPTVGREPEIERVTQILSRRNKNSPVLVGEPGVGKTAIVEALAQRIAKGNVPGTLRGRRLVSLDMASLVAGTKYRGEFEERLKKVIEEVKSASPKCVLFVDEIHTMVGAGAAEGAVDAANILKPSLARGEIQAIGATTMDEYRKYIERDAALERRLQQVSVDQPNSEETVKILRGIKGAYEEHHGLQIKDEALKVASHLASRYIPDRFLPDKAIDLIDEAAARKRIQLDTPSPEMDEVRSQLDAVTSEKEAAISQREYEVAAAKREREAELKSQLEELEQTWEREREIRESSGDWEVSPTDVEEVVSMWTGIPVMQLTASQAERLINMEATLRERVVGQDEAITTVSKAVRRARAGLKDPKRPAGTFMFHGPSGVGKTYLVEKLAEFLFDSEEAVVRIDMSEFMDRHTVSRLVGSPPGYIGHDEGGQLTEAVRRRSYSVILLDEIEKAHQEVYNILLQIFDDGHLTDSKGRRVDFRNSIIVMTSNIGSSQMRDDRAMGFSLRADGDEEDERRYARMKQNVLDEVKRYFRPEFLNRVDAQVVFHSLTRDQMTQIVDLMLVDVNSELLQKGIDMEVTDGAKTWLVEKGFDRQFGARPLRRVIQDHLEDKLSDAILSSELRFGDTALVDVDTGDEDGEGGLAVTARSPVPVASS